MNTELLDPTLPESVEKKLKKCPALPSLPAVVVQVIEASKDPDIGLAEVSHIIQLDPALSAKILKIANSPLYSLRRKVHNLREALTLLGLNASLTIALSFSLVKSLRDSTNDTLYHLEYWRRSIVAATAARQLGRKLGLMNLEDIFLGALLQDIGILAMECVDTEFYSIGKDIRNFHQSAIKVELNKIGVDHSATGAWLMKYWHLPDKLRLAVATSHSTNDSIDDEEFKHFHWCVATSGMIADLWLSNEDEKIVKTLISGISAISSISEKEVLDLLHELYAVLPDMESVFDIQLTTSLNRDSLLDEARELLLERNILQIKQAENDRRQIEVMTQKTRDLEDASRRDALTGVFNRSHFDQLLDEEFDNSNLNRWPLSMAFIDLDNFKIINDTYGHLTGDEVLKAATRFISSRIRQTDVLARFGGDEFILLLPGSIMNDASNLLNRLISDLQEENGLLIDEEETIKVTFSIGIATHMETNDFNDVQQFLNAADKALYNAKETGRNKVACFNDSII